MNYLAIVVLASWAAVLASITASPENKVRGGLPLVAFGSSLALAVWVLT